MAEFEESVISLAEVSEVVKKHLNGNVPGEDEAPDAVRPSWLTHLFSVAWSLGKVPVDWQTRMVVQIFIKGDQRVS